MPVVFWYDLTINYNSKRGSFFCPRRAGILRLTI